MGSHGLGLSTARATGALESPLLEDQATQAASTDDGRSSYKLERYSCGERVAAIDQTPTTRSSSSPVVERRRDRVEVVIAALVDIVTRQAKSGPIQRAPILRLA